MRRGMAMMALAAIVVAGGGVAMGEHTQSCNGEVTPVETPAGTLYVDDRGVDDGGIWLYQESNEIEGLQSGGTSLTLDEPDDCEAVGHPTPDTLIF